MNINMCSLTPDAQTFFHGQHFLFPFPNEINQCQPATYSSGLVLLIGGFPIPIIKIMKLLRDTMLTNDTPKIDIFKVQVHLLEPC